MRVLRALLGAAALAAVPAVAASGAGETHVAVAANFTAASKEIAAAFKAESGNEAVLSFGSSGQLYAQIGQGAPFSAMLSADEARPKRAVAAGLGVKGSRFTYAVGKLVLWSRSPGVVKGEQTLKEGGFATLAIANPAAAPYGAAAVETLKALGVYGALQPKIVQGNSIAQAFQFVETGNAEVGFVALGQVADSQGGSRWVVPQALYTPIRQDAVLLTRGKDDAVARAFLRFLKGAEARAIIERFGYGAAE